MLNFSVCSIASLTRLFTVTPLSALSLTSSVRLNTTLSGSIFNGLPWKILLSITAHSKLFAAVIAWKSPVKCRLISSIGKICEYPPPVAPPLTPKTGPRDGSRNARQAFAPIKFNASASPIETVVFPSPAAVGLIAVTSISFESFRGLGTDVTFALNLPYSSKSFSSTPKFAAISVICCSRQLRAISMSVKIKILLLSRIIKAMSNVIASN